MDRSHSHFIRNVSFRQLQVFDSIIRNGSFTAAASELFLTQPTVSAQIKRLEESIGVTLFDHVGRNVRLTDQGRALKDLCLQIFHAVDDFESGLARQHNAQLGELSLAGGLTSEYFFPLLLGTFCRRYPGIRVTLTITERGKLLDRLRRKQDDMWLLSHPPEDPDLVSEALITDSMVLVCHPAHRLTRRSALSVVDLESENLLVREEGAGSRITLQRFLEQHGRALQARMELNSNEAIKQAVLNGLGIALLSGFEVNQELQDGRLARLPLEGLPIHEVWYLVYHRHRPLTNIGELFRQSALGEGRLLLSAVLEPEN